MPKKKIHPTTNKITIVDTNGNKIEIVSCLKQGEYRLTSDHTTHSAWTKADRNKVKAGKIQKLEKKYKGFENF